MSRPGYGSQKGASYERSLATLFSLWITDNEREDVLWRTAMSGGRATIGRRKGRSFESQAGDIGPTDGVAEWFCEQFLIEAKRYSSFEWVRDIADLHSACPKKATRRPLEIFLHTVDEARRAKRAAPLAILRADRQPDICITSGKGYDMLTVGERYNIRRSLVVPSIDAHVFRLDGLVPSVPYAQIEARYKK